MINVKKVIKRMIKAYVLNVLIDVKNTRKIRINIVNA